MVRMSTLVVLLRTSDRKLAFYAAIAPQRDQLAVERPQTAAESGSATPNAHPNGQKRTSEGCTGGWAHQWPIMPAQ